jgi:hypothetical protein
MGFLFPVVFWGLLLLAIPILIHLFRFRRYKVIHFSRIAWLQNLVNREQSSRKLKHYLILASRLLGLLFLIIAFSQPFRFSSDNDDRFQGNTRIIFIDNSQSMMAGDGQKSAWTTAQESADMLIRSFPEDARWLILSHNLDPRAFEEVQSSEALQRILELRRTYAHTSWQEVFKQIETAKMSSEVIESFIISDFQYDESLEEVDQLSGISAIRVGGGASIETVSVDSLWFNPPGAVGQILEVEVKLVNYGKEEVRDMLVELRLNDSLRAAQRVSIGANAQVNLSLSTTIQRAGLHRGSVRIDDFPVVYDDELFFHFRVAEAVPVSLITANSPSSRVLKAILSDAAFSTNVQTAGSLSPADIRSSSVIFLHSLDDIPGGLLDPIMESGARLVIVMPQANVLPAGYQRLFDRLQIPTSDLTWQRTPEPVLVSGIKWDDPLFRGVFARKEDKPEVPSISGYWNFSASQATLKLANGVPVLFKSPRSSGQEVYIWSAPFDAPHSNLHDHAILVPLIHNLALFTAGSQRVFRWIGEESVALYRLQEKDVQLSVDFPHQGLYSPSQRLRGLFSEVYWDDKPSVPGVYSLMQNSKIIGFEAFNASRSQSSNPLMDDDQLASIFGENATNVGLQSERISAIHASSDKHIWWWWLLAALGAFLLEVIWIRFLP